MASATARQGGRPSASLPPVPHMTVEALLGVADDQVEAALAAMLREATGEEMSPGAASVEVVSHSLGAPATHGVYRVRGGGAEGWSLFCKVIQSPRHWDGLAQMPPEIAEHFVASFPWRTELELWDPRVQSSLPPGMRSPILHALIELGDDRVAIWQEDVALAPPSADLAQYDRAGRLLGRWNARSVGAEILAVSEFPPGYALRMYAENAVPMRALPALADDVLWSHPWLTEHGDVREALLVLAPKIPAMLDRLDGFMQCLPHGDASPQNLLIPAGSPETFVVIDLSFRTPHPLGFDLAQLLVGLTQAGDVPAALLPEIAGRSLRAYLRGVAEERISDQDDDIRDAFVTTSLLRSGFDSMLYELIGSEDPADRYTFDERIALTRFIVEQYQAVHPPRVPQSVPHAP